MEKKLPDDLKKFVVEMMEERMKLPSMAQGTQTEEKEKTGIEKQVMDFPRDLPMDSPPSYTTEVRRYQGNETVKDASYLKEKETLAGIKPEVIHSQKNVADKERVRGFPISGPANVEYLPPPGISEENGYRGLDEQQTHPKERIREYFKDINGNERYKPLVKSKKKWTTDPARAIKCPPSEKKVIIQGVLQEQPKIVVPPEISPAEYLEAIEHAKIIAGKQGREDIQEILQMVLRAKAQGKREFEKASTKQTAARGSSQRGAEPPR